MDLSVLSRKELLSKCEELKITKYKSKNKSELIELITSESKYTKNVSPLRYPGGKTRACKILDGIVTEHFDIKQYDSITSPFFGGGSFEFYMQNKYDLKLIVNDKFTPLFNFWKQISTDKDELCENLRKIENVTKEQFLKYRGTITKLDSDILQQSIQYFIINRCSFSGATLSGGFSKESSSKRFTVSSIDRIKSLDFSNIDIHNFDFEDFIQKYHNSKSLLFLDPPYYLDKKSKLYGKSGDMHENFDHERLYNMLKTKNSWILTYNNCEYIRNMYQNYCILDAEWSYSMNKTKISSEIVIISK